MTEPIAAGAGPCPSWCARHGRGHVIPGLHFRVLGEQVLSGDSDLSVLLNHSGGRGGPVVEVGLHDPATGCMADCGHVRLTPAQAGVLRDHLDEALALAADT